MDKKIILWSLTLFFGSWIVFGAINSAVGDDRLLSLGLQALALVIIIAAVVVISRRKS